MPILDPNALIYKPYARVNCLKTIPFTAAHTHIIHIWQYPLPPPGARVFVPLDQRSAHSTGQGLRRHWKRDCFPARPQFRLIALHKLPRNIFLLPSYDSSFKTEFFHGEQTVTGHYQCRYRNRPTHLFGRANILMATPSKRYSTTFMKESPIPICYLWDR